MFFACWVIVILNFVLRQCWWFQPMATCDWNSIRMFKIISRTIIKRTVKTKVDGLVLFAAVTSHILLLNVAKLFNEFIFLQIFQPTLWNYKFNLALWTFWWFLRKCWWLQTFQAKTVRTRKYSWINHTFHA